MIEPSLRSLYAVAGHASTARELFLFTRFLVLDKRYTQQPPGSQATDAQRYEFVRKMSAVERGAPINTDPPIPCPRQGKSFD